MIGHNSEPLLKQLFLLISKEGKNHFILIIFLKSVDTELKFPRIVATDLDQHPNNTSSKTSKLWRINEKRH